MIGLVEAADRFDPSRGIPFSRFAATRIRGAMLDSVRTADWAPRSVRRPWPVTPRPPSSSSPRSWAARRSWPRWPRPSASPPAELDQLRDQVNRGVVMTLDHAYGDDASMPLVATIVDPDSPEPDLVLESDRARRLPARRRRRPARAPPRRDPGLLPRGPHLPGDRRGPGHHPVPRVSQLRADALEMMREGLEAQYRTGTASAPSAGSPGARAATPRAIARQSSWKARVTLTSGADLEARRLPYVADA